MAIKPKAALSLAYWLQVNHPDIFAVLAKQAQVSATRNTLAGTCCAGCGGLGDDDTLDYFTPTNSYVSYPDMSFDTLDLSSMGITPIDFSFDPSTIEMPTISDADLTYNQPAPASGATTSTGSGIMSGISSALGAVGKLLTNPAVVSSVVGLGTQVLKNQQTQAVLQAQTSRVLAGQNPAAISYTVDPTTGQVVPVVQTPYGQSAYATPYLPALSSASGQISQFVSQYGLYLGIGLLALVIARR